MKLKEIISESKKLRVFDFDDVLVKTDSNVYVTHLDGSTTKLTPGEYAVYKPKRGDRFDYSDFDEVKNPRMIKAVTEVLRKMAAKGDKRGVYILTARGNARPIEQYIRDIGIGNVKVIALDNSDPEAKADWVERQVQNKGYDDVYFIDDAQPNVKAVKRRLQGLGVKHNVQLMKGTK